MKKRETREERKEREIERVSEKERWIDRQRGRRWIRGRSGTETCRADCLSFAGANSLP